MIIKGSCHDWLLLLRRSQWLKIIQNAERPRCGGRIASLLCSRQPNRQPCDFLSSQTNVCTLSAHCYIRDKRSRQARIGGFVFYAPVRSLQGHESSVLDNLSWLCEFTVELPLLVPARLGRCGGHSNIPFFLHSWHRVGSPWTSVHFACMTWEKYTYEMWL